MFGLSKAEKASKKLSQAIEGMEKGFVVHKAYKAERVGLETFEIPLPTLKKEKLK